MCTGMGNPWVLEGFLEGTGRGTKYLTRKKPVPMAGNLRVFGVHIVELDQAISMVV